MKEHCKIDGKRCTKCCETLTVKQNKNGREWFKYVRNNGYPDDFSGDNVFHMLSEISKRRAKKKNPFLVGVVGRGQSYFTCKNFKNGKCSIYDSRPKMCRDYPEYGHSKKEWSDWVGDEDNLIGLYRPDCTYYDKSFYPVDE